MMNIQLIAVMALVAFLSGFGTGWKVNGWRYLSEREIAAQAASDALTKAAKEIAKIEVKNVTIKQEIQTRIIEKPVYRECKHDDGVLRLLNETLTNQSTSDIKLSKPDPVK